VHRQGTPRMLWSGAAVTVCAANSLMKHAPLFAAVHRPCSAPLALFIGRNAALCLLGHTGRLAMG
jgi:hypothetical protein